MTTRRPTADEINVFNTLDERSAVQHFLGKDLAQAKELFRECFPAYHEDLMVMGPTAFGFYVPAALAYLCSDEADGDSDAANMFCGVVEFRFDVDRDGIVGAVPMLREGIIGILRDFGRFHCDPVFYGDLAARYQVLLSKLAGFA